MSLLFELFVTFFKIGLFTIGGGYAMIPLIQKFLVEKSWLTVGEVADVVLVDRGDQNRVDFDQDPQRLEPPDRLPLPLQQQACRLEAAAGGGRRPRGPRPTSPP